MSGRLDDPKEMQYIYVASKDVFEGKYSETYAIESLRGKVKGTPSSIKMYFKIYSCMRRAECYKMGTSEAFTKFLLNSIYRDSGEEAYLHALIAVKGNYAYRVSCQYRLKKFLRQISLHSLTVRGLFQGWHEKSLE